MERKHYYAIDIAKFVSACLVICIHTGPLLDINTEANFVLVQIIARIAVPFFFIASGFFLYKKLDLNREWNDHSNINVLKHYVVRNAKIYIIWTILYLPFTYMILHAGDGITLTSIVRYIRDFFFTGSYYHLWFLPSLIVSAVLSYFLIKKTSIKKALFISFTLYIVGMFGNVYPTLLEEIPVIDVIWKVYSSLFVTTRNGLFFGLIFIVMGAYMSHLRIYLKFPFVCLGGMLSLILLFVECFFIRDGGFMSDMTSMYLMLLPCVGFFFLFLLQLSLAKRKIYQTLRNMSLLIYVSHIMFVSVMIWTLPKLNSLIVYILTLIASFVCSYGIIWVSRRIKVLKALY